MWFAHLLIYYTILLSFLFAFKTKIGYEEYIYISHGWFYDIL